MPEFSSPISRTKLERLGVGYVLVHTLLHISAFWFEVLPGIAVSIWYAPCGLALALLVLLGPRYAWLVFLTNFATSWITVTAEPRVPWTAFFFPGLLTVNYALAAWGVRRLIGPRLLPGNPRETVVFCATIIGAPLGPAIVGTAVSAAMFGLRAPADAWVFARSVRDWWIGDATGLLTVVPVAMVFLGPWLEGTPRRAVARGTTWIGFALAGVRGAVLLGTLCAVLLVPVLREHSAFYLCFLPLVWICVSHGLRGATLATLAVMIVGLVGMRLAETTVDYSYVFLLFVIAVAGVGLGLGTMVKRRDEAEARLAASNSELEQLRRLEFDEKVAAQLAEEKARLEVLRYQLNPHFLYNSLNSIYGLLFESARDAGEMVLRLADFCRATLTGATDELPTVGAEVETMRTYLEVEQVRWGEKLQVEIAVTPEAEGMNVPPFLLLPLVENAIKYGGLTSPDGLRLRISARGAGERLCIEVANTGQWLAAEHGRVQSTGIGLSNLRQRLRRYYPGAHEFSTGEAGGWVTARLEIAGKPRRWPVETAVPAAPVPERVREAVL